MSDMGDVASEAFLRITEKYGFDETTRELNKITDSADLEVFLLSYSLMYALGSLTSISGGFFKSTDDKPVYAGGVESPGNRIYTPAEGAAHSLEAIDKFKSDWS